MKFVDGKRVKRSRRTLVTVLAGIAFLIFAVIAVIGVRHLYIENLKPVSGSDQVITIEIPSGSTTKEIADTLKQNGLIRADWAFQWYVNNASIRDKLQAGTYELRPNQSVEQIVAQLTRGAVATKLVTILPGARIDEVQQAFIDSGFQKEDVERAFDPALYVDSPVLADKPANITTLEGLLYPDSFQRDNTTRPEQIVRQSLELMQKQLTPEVRAAFAKQGLTTYQGLILASIVEKEVPNGPDRPIVAQVFLKRLKIDMPLATDASDKYGAALIGKPTDNSAVNLDTPYNTRLHGGLPPTPIASVEKTAIKAVTNPANTDWLFFVSGDDDVTYYSKTNQEHEALVQQHCKIKCS
ncbi:MAG: endolytic transglycosylase MltG [Candidatus Saccharimonadales bacterium]